MPRILASETSDRRNRLIGASWRVKNRSHKHSGKGNHLKRLIARFARLSPSVVVAMLALFVAMGGTAIAAGNALITGKQIKNSSITGADVKNKSLTSKDIKGQLRGPRGLRGLKGDKGDKGDPGAPNPNAVNAQNADKLNGLAANQLASILQGQADTNNSGVNLANAGRTAVNTVSINAPVAGVLMISGSAFINNGSGAVTNYVLAPKVDGTALQGEGGWQTLTAYGASGAAALHTLAYTVSTSVAAGDHTVTQEIGPYTGTATFFYNRNNLSVLFVPTGGVTVASTAAAAGSGSGN
jgi:hypothetical protein